MSPGCPLPHPAVNTRQAFEQCSASTGARPSEGCACQRIDGKKKTEGSGDSAKKSCYWSKTHRSTLTAATEICTRACGLDS
ncbi:hypothetical protein M8J75_002551 [Diaphorina citri]|nr:hypothetical protein M8J75_002551 [Diaphorina citri]